jgi:hypothetical protein
LTAPSERQFALEPRHRALPKPVATPLPTESYVHLGHDEHWRNATRLLS